MLRGKYGQQAKQTFDKYFNKKEVVFRETHENDFDGDGYFDSRITIHETYEGRAISAVDQWLEDRGFFGYPYVASVENIEKREGKLTESTTQEETIVHVNDKEVSNLSYFAESKIDYNKKGDIEKIQQSNWNSGGMIVDSLVSYEYGKRGSIAEKITEVDRWITLEEQGNVDFRTTEKFTYDKKGRLDEKLTQTQRADNGDLVADYPIIHELFDYDRRGNLTNEEVQYDFGDGRFATVYTKDITYDVRGNVTNIVEEDFGRTIRTYFEYDTRGNLIKEDKVSFGDYRYTYEFEYDLKGNLKTEVFKSNVSGGDEIDDMLVKSFEYDRKGNILSEEIEQWKINPQEDGTWKLTIEKVDLIDYSYIFDRRGNVLTKVKEYDFESNDTIDRIDTYAFRYDRKGDMISKIFEEDVGADNITEYRVVTERLESNELIGTDYTLDQLLA